MKPTPLISVTFLIALMVFSCDTDQGEQWTIKQAPLMTEWADDVRADHPWNHYPRPYLKRKHWVNLNGLWEYAINHSNDSRPDTMQGEILVPYPLESALSGVMERLEHNEQIWYSRQIEVPVFNKGERIILHFEAVDWHARIWINNQPAGEHLGGYSPFLIDITEHVASGKQADLLLSVQDPSTQGTQAVGKQNSQPHGIWYTPSSGIWQTVWMEKVPSSYIVDYKAVADIDQAQVFLSTEVVHPKDTDQIRYRVRYAGHILEEIIGAVNETVVVPIPEMHLWSPDNPALYDLEITLLQNGEKTDQVEGYFGMRKISLGKDAQGVTRILLNNEFLFQNGTLDQGFWPDGLYTPPTEKAMLYDLEMLKSMGFNMLRKHVKVENRRFYYWTDKMGLLVWQDMPNGYFGRPVNEINTGSSHAIQFEKELQEMILTLDNHPSIVMWVPFNEGWGQYDTERIVKYITALDPTRLINNASGWTDKGVGHILDIHHYPDPIAPLVEPDRAIVLGEFGGLGLPVQGHTWQQEENWGYENMDGAESLLEKYERFYQEVDRLVKEEGLSAVVYTQTTDVEIETNGLMSYDRKVDKMGADNLRKAHKGYIPPYVDAPLTDFIHTYSIKLKTARPGAQIHYTLDGSEPDRKSQLYTKEMVVTESSQMKAIAYWKDGEESRIGTYRFNKRKPLAAGSSATKKGLTYALYEGAWEQLPEFDLLDPINKGVSKSITLDPAGKRTQDFGLVFQGFIQVPETNVYQFYVSSDDGGRLVIDKQVIVNYDGIHGMGEKSGIVALEKGSHAIEFYYFQHLGGRGLDISWSSENMAKAPIQPNNLKH